MAEIDRRGVFLSWSKPVAAEIAKNLKPFIEDVLGTATVFMSQEMDGGTRWAMEIPQRLEACNAGLVIVTQENCREPWLHFEAGALSKHVDESRVVPLLCGASIGDIQGTPLSLFQAKSLDHDDFLSVCLSFGTAFGVSDDAVRRRYGKSWPEVQNAVDGVKGATHPKGQLDLSDIMAVLERVSSQVSIIETSVKRDSFGQVLAAYGAPSVLPGAVYSGGYPPLESSSFAEKIAEVAGEHPLRTNSLQKLKKDNG